MAQKHKYKIVLFQRKGKARMTACGGTCLQSQYLWNWGRGGLEDWGQPGLHSGILQNKNKADVSIWGSIGSFVFFFQTHCVHETSLIILKLFLSSQLKFSDLRKRKDLFNKRYHEKNHFLIKKSKHSLEFGLFNRADFMSLPPQRPQCCFLVFFWFVFVGGGVPILFLVFICFWDSFQAILRLPMQLKLDLCSFCLYLVLGHTYPLTPLPPPSDPSSPFREAFEYESFSISPSVKQTTIVPIYWSYLKNMLVDFAQKSLIEYLLVFVASYF